MWLGQNWDIEVNLQFRFDIEVLITDLGVAGLDIVARMNIIAAADNEAVRVGRNFRVQHRDAPRSGAGERERKANAPP